MPPVVSMFAFHDERREMTLSTRGRRWHLRSFFTDKGSPRQEQGSSDSVQLECCLMTPLQWALLAIGVMEHLSKLVSNPDAAPKLRRIASFSGPRTGPAALAAGIRQHHRCRETYVLKEMARWPGDANNPRLSAFRKSEFNAFMTMVNNMGERGSP